MREIQGVDRVARPSQCEGSEEADRLAARRKSDGRGGLLSGIGEIAEEPFPVSAERQPGSSSFLVVRVRGRVCSEAGQLAGFCLVAIDASVSDWAPKSSF